MQKRLKTLLTLILSGLFLITNTIYSQEPQQGSFQFALVSYTGSYGSVYTNGSIEIYSISADGKHVSKFNQEKINGFNPVWSPDGSKIAFSSSRNGYSEIYLMNADCSGEKRLTNMKAYLNEDLSWSPDSKEIVFVSRHSKKKWKESDIYRVNVNDGKLTRLTNDSILKNSPIWSPDGQKIAYGQYRHLYIINPDGNLIADIDFPYPFNPSWSPDGKTILLDNSASIFSVDVESKNDKQLFSGNDGGTDPSWSSDGKYIVYIKYFTGFNVYIMNANGKNRRLIKSYKDEAKVLLDPRFSPNNMFIAVNVRDKNDNHFIHILDLNGNILAKMQGVFHTWNSQNQVTNRM